MAGKLLHIGDYLCGCLSPCRATHTTAMADAVAGHIALEWTQDKLSVSHKVEAYPKPSEGLAQGGCSVGQYTHLLMLVGDVGEKVGDELLVTGGFVGDGVGECGFQGCCIRNKN